MNCFVINLKSYTEKKEKMVKRLSKFSFKYEFFNAVEGMEEKYLENIEINKEWRDPYSGRVMTHGEVGCSLSHLNIYKKALVSENNVTLILEDDAEFVDNFEEKLENILDELKNTDWDVCYLGRKLMGKDGEEISKNLKVAGYSYWTIGYLVNKKGAKKLIDGNIEKNLIPIDEYIPILSQQSPLNNKYGKYYNSSIKLLTVKDLLIKPENNSFQSSSTENSPLITISDKRLLILATGTDMNDALKRFIESCEIYGLEYKILGLGQKWNGGNMSAGIGGGQKINFLVEELSNLDDDQLIFVSDSYDVIMSSNTEEIINKFNKFKTPIVFAAEKDCWPDKRLINKYPETESPWKFLNSGGFMGKVKHIKQILPEKYKNNGDDQLYYTKQFLENQDLISLDYNCDIFQCVNSSKDDIEINFNNSRIRNKKYNTYPCQVHGNGPWQIKVHLGRLESYLMKNWSNTYRFNNKNLIKFDNSKTVYIFIPILSLDFDNFMKGILDINYPKENIVLTFYNFLNIKLSKKINTFKNYKNIQVIEHKTDSFAEILNWSMTDCKEDYYFYIEPSIYLSNPNIFQNLMVHDKGFIAPFINNINENWNNNFWGELDNNGFYKRSFDFFDISNGKRKGCWNVPFVRWTYLIKKEYLNHLKDGYTAIANHADMSICKVARNKNISIYINNLHNFGFQKTIKDKIPSTALRSEFYMFETDRKAWFDKYCHPDFIKAINNWKNLPLNEICSDSYEFPFFNELFCDHLIDEVNNINEWSGGGNKKIKDKRINGYENIPTIDIHMKQIGFRKQWEIIVMEYISKLVSHVYSPYQTKGLNISFVVKYEMGKQEFLQPHHDSATYSLVITLNKPGIDFKGGGTRFIRQNVVHNGKKGYCTVHPGKLTHYHEGVKITDGIRYIMVSFIN